MAAFAVARWMPVACLILMFVGLIQSVLHAMSTTLVQVNVPDRVRGRVMSLYGMLIIGVPKVGGVLIAGPTLCSGVICLDALGATPRLSLRLAPASTDLPHPTHICKTVQQTNRID